ncbi:MAG TPA: hypothetical protein VLN61_09635, partial [Pseudolabrys sp.]|nr:hypothetical protein [Pseudolabrys sp.]
SRTPTPNSATNNPLAAISSSFPDASPGDRIEIHQAAINRKIRAIAMISCISTAACCDLLHECRTRLSAALAGMAGRTVKSKTTLTTIY